MSNTFTKGYADSSALTEAQLDTAYQTLQLDVANTALMTTGSSTGQALISNGSNTAASFQTISDPQGPFALRNYGLKATAASGVLVISLKTKALADPSGSDKVDFNYSTNGTTSATYSSVQVSAATTFSITASATLSYTATSTIRIFTYGYYNSTAAAVKLAVSLRSDLDNGGSVAALAMSASADSGSAIYATAALTIVPRLLGWIEAAHNSGYSWQTPTKVNITNDSPFSQYREVASTVGKTGIAVSSGSGSFISFSTAVTAVTNLSVTITSSGRPIRLELDGTPTSSISSPSYVQNSFDGNSGYVLFKRNGTVFSILVTNGTTTNTEEHPTKGYGCIDIVAAGTYTYSVAVQVTAGTASIGVVNCRLIAYEL